MSLKLKIFSSSDINFLLKLRNQKDVILNSINKKKITKKIHQDWFKKIIKKHTNFNFIIYYKSKKIGFLRFEKIKNRYFVNIAIIRNARNKNFAKKSLLLGEYKTKIKNLYAKVLKNNIKSLSLFKSCNYNIISTYKKYYLMKKKINKSEKIIDQIELLRKKNNTNWMKILKIAFKHDPKNASKAIGNVNKFDKKISKLSYKLSNYKNG